MNIKNLKTSITNWFNRLKQRGKNFISQAKKRAQKFKDSHTLIQLILGTCTGLYILLVVLRLFGSSQGIPLKLIGWILFACWSAYGLFFKKTRGKTLKLLLILVIIGGIIYCLIQSPTSFINSWAVVISWIVALGLCFYIMCVGKASWRWPIFLTLLFFSLFIRLFIGAITPKMDSSTDSIQRTACFSTTFTGDPPTSLTQNPEDSSSTSETQPDNLLLLEKNWLQLFNTEHLEDFTFLQSLWEAIFKTGQLLMWGDNAPAFVQCGREALKLYGVGSVWINAFILFTSFANTMIPLSFTGFLIDVLLWFLPELRIWVLPFGAIRFVFGSPTEENLLLGETIKEALEDERGFKIIRDYLCTSSTPHADENQVPPKPPKLWLKNLRIQFIYTDWNLNRKSKNYLRAKNMGAICTSKSVSKLSLRHSRRVAYFLCDEQTSENFAILEKLSHKSHGKYLYAPYKTKVYIFAENPGWEDTLKTFKYSLITKGNMTLEIQIIKDYATLPMQLMEKVPLFAPLLPDDCPKTSNGKKILSVLVIGSASQAAEYIKTVFWAGQMNKVDLRITAIGLSAEKIKDKLVRKCPEILRSCEENHPLLNFSLKNNFEKYNSPYANIRFVSTKDITRCPPELLEEAQQANYIICALNSDEENAHLALDLKRFLTYPIIQNEIKSQPAKIEDQPQKSTFQNDEFKLRIIVPIIKQNLTNSLRQPIPKVDDKDFAKKCISPNMVNNTLEDSIIIAPFGLDKERYSLKSMLRLDLYRYWRLSDKLYHELQGQVNGKCNVNNPRTLLSFADQEYSIWNNEYGPWNNWARSIHALYKVFDLGLIEKIKFSPEGLDAFVDAKKTTPDYIKRLVKNEANDGSLLQNLTWIEHRRWVAFTRSLGYTHLDEKNFVFLSPGKTHFPSFKAHACLCESDWIYALPSVLRETALQGHMDQLDEIGQELIDAYKKHPNWKESSFKELSGDNKYFDLPFLDMRLSMLICFDATGKGDCNGLYKVAQEIYGEGLFPSEVLSEETDII